MKLELLNQAICASSYALTPSFENERKLLQDVDKGQLEILRLWRHKPTIVLSPRETRLPYYETGLAYLNEQGYETTVRDSGGLAVVLDKGILNLSLLFPNTDSSLHIGNGFERMAEFIQTVLTHYGVQADIGKVDGSYCPGSFDMSISGRKIAGISGRVTSVTKIVRAYICVEGSGAGRAQVIKTFYEKTGAYSEAANGYPIITPKICGSLQETIGNHISMDRVIKTVSSRVWASR